MSIIFFMGCPSSFHRRERDGVVTEGIVVSTLKKVTTVIEITSRTAAKAVTQQNHASARPSAASENAHCDPTTPSASANRARCSPPTPKTNCHGCGAASGRVHGRRALKAKWLPFSICSGEAIEAILERNERGDLTMGVRKLFLVTVILAASTMGVAAVELVNPHDVLKRSQREGIEFDKRMERYRAEREKEQKEREAKQKIEEAEQQKREKVEKALQEAQRKREAADQQKREKE
jgi:hypothetical protein